MNTINCRIKTNDFSDSPGVGVTPAEVILLRTVHDKHAGGCCIRNARPAGQAMTQTGVKPATVTQTDTGGVEVTMKTTVPVERPRTDAEEIARLRAKYQVRAKSGAPGTHICDELFGGTGLAVRLPQTFAELPEKFKQGLIIEIPRPEAGNVALLDGGKDEAGEDENHTDDKTDPASGTDDGKKNPGATASSVRDELLPKTKGELVEIATSYGVENVGKLNKSELIEAILAKAGYAEPATA